ncbi:MAG: TAXI family TRAP transporter solute-binding subunit [Deltaproteobacteria bacterium]|nr:TAXI family TRAP transporter solute-binding subunit [Deltaproteobacteria bacterium]
MLLVAASQGQSASRQDTAARARSRDSARISILMATGMPGGTYYHVGLGMASLWTTKLRGMGIRVSAAISEGSRENIEAIRIADADIVVAEDFFCSMAYTGTSVYKGQPLTELRAITSLWPETVNLLIRSEKLKTGTLQDLEGLTLATGLHDSGNKYTTELLIDSEKSLRHTVRLRSMSNAAAVEALRNGTVQAVDLTGGTPVPVISSLFHEGKPYLAFLEITDSQMEAVRAEGWTNVFRSVIPPGTYFGQDKAVNSVGQMNVLATTAALDPDVVYALTKTLYENLDYMARVHPACRSIVLDKAFEGITVPLHLGAIRYYRERQIRVPESLIP